MTDVDMTLAFFSYARERELIRICREQGQERSWTTDPVLQRYRFCNVFREDDKTTTWFRDNARDRLASDHEKVVFATFLFRWFNRIESGQRLLDAGLLLNGQAGWDPVACRRALRDVSPIVTGAYMIKTPPGLVKLEGVISCVQQTVDMGILSVVGDGTRREMDTVHEMLQVAPYLGVFMAYEIVTDLRWTAVLGHTNMHDTWASPGPGCARGLDHIFGGRRRTYTHPVSRAQMIEEMRTLLAISRDEELWPQEWGIWELRDVEHTLCEFDKYMRGLSGERLKRRFNP